MKQPSYLDLAKHWRFRVKSGRRIAITLLLSQERMKKAAADTTANSSAPLVKA